MKLNFGKRLVLFLHWLVSLVIAASLIFNIDSYQEKIDTLFGASIGLYVLICVAVVYVLLSVLTVCFVLRNDQKRAERGFITMDSSDTGKVRIAVSAVEQMVKQAIGTIDGVNDMKIGVVGADDSVNVRVNVVVVNGVHVPTVTLNMQRAIRQYVEMNCGVAVSNVAINVSEVANNEMTEKTARTAVTPVAAPTEMAPVVPETPTVSAETELEETPEVSAVPVLTLETPVEEENLPAEEPEDNVVE